MTLSVCSNCGKPFHKFDEDEAICTVCLPDTEKELDKGEAPVIP